MESFRFRHGLSAPGPAPTTALKVQERAVSSVALYGGDYLGPRWKLLVDVGQHVTCGEPIFRDRHNQELNIVSPCNGNIETIELGARRKVGRIVVNVDEASQNPYQCRMDPAAAGENPAALKKYLLASGLWVASRARPYGLVPAIEQTPLHIFVNACQKTGNTPDPAMISSPDRRWFDRGADALAALAEQAVFICQNAPDPLYHGDNAKVSCVRFSGAYSARLTSTHIQALTSSETMAWAIGWQDVLAIGKALETGIVSWRRKVVVGGDAARIRIVVDAPIGASLRNLTTGIAQKPADKMPMSVLSGDAIAGVPSSHLHRFDDSVSLQLGRGGLSRLGSTQAISPLIPRNALINALPFGEPALPLMRALMSHDHESAQKLGAQKMVEEDVAQLTRQCANGVDYGKLLRAALISFGGATR